MRILGLSGHFHDAAAALVVDGELVAAAQEERFSRRKHDASLPTRAARFCLARAGLRGEDLDAIVWHEKPLLKFERVLFTSLRSWPRGATAFRRAMISMVGDKLWVKAHIAHALGVAPARIEFSGHHASHAAAAFYCSPFDAAAVLCVDGVGEWATTSTWTARRDGGLTPLDELHFPHSIGLLYSVFTAFLGFEVNDGECKVMGLAGYGVPRHRDALDRVARFGADGTVELDLDYFLFHRDPDRAWAPALEALFGAPRAPGAPIEDRHRDIAATLQAWTEDALLTLARRLHERTGAAHLCLAGGVALNAVAVGRILREGPFEDVFVQPAAGDAGSSVGAAMLRAGAGSPLRHMAWGGEASPDQARRLLVEGGVSHVDHGEEGIVTEVARRLAEGQVVGWFQGRFELGPRALGQRSILADPRDAAARERLNRRIKFREPFRPFAPAILADAAPRHFDLGRSGGWAHRFMTSVVPTRDDRFPAARHVDGTARIQCVHAEDTPTFARLLAAYGALTGVPCLLNTSFNLAGEPIVATPADAWATFVRCQMDALAIGPFLVTR